MSKGDIGINHAVKLVRDTAEELLAASEPNADHRYAIEYTADAIVKALVGIDRTKTSITPVLQYRTQDGHQFDTFVEAREREVALSLAQRLDNESGLYFDRAGSSPFDVAEWVLKNYNIEPK